MLTGYCWDNGKLCYKPRALKAFGLLKMEEEDGTEFLVLRKLHWFNVPTVDLVVIGSVSEQCVDPCPERPCTGVVSFFDRSLGGPVEHTGGTIVRSIRVRNMVLRSLSSTHPIISECKQPLTANMTELCPALGLQMTEVWWNIEPTHYYNVKHGQLCHLVSPQYNCHGNYLVGSEKTKVYHTVPTNCANDSYAVRLYFYHGTIGFYSFFEEIQGTYCTKDRTIYGAIDGLGTFDINGWLLSQDTGNYGYRWSGWYAPVGSIWIIYRGLVVRRSYVACKRYGRKCDQLGEVLDRKAVMVFVQENMRLSAHGATNYQRIMLLYLLIEGIMSDLFLLVATEGIFSWFQYTSLGYNLSGVVLLSFEMIENMGWLRESTRLAIKRLLFSYESSLVGELLSAIGLSHFLTALSRSDFKRSGITARAVSYYVWGLVGHAVVAFTLIGSIMFIRIVRAVTYMRWKHGVWWEVFTAPCCVDTTLGMLNKMTMLRGYEWKGGKLYYNYTALKAFGLLKMDEEDGTEYLVLRKIHWFKMPEKDLVVIGIVSGQIVEPCSERPCVDLSVASADIRFVLNHFSIEKLFTIMKLRRMFSFSNGPHGQLTAAARYHSYMTAQRKLWVAWIFLGVVPFILQCRSYVKLATPHKITENLLVPPGVKPKTDNMTELCVLKEFHIGLVWWNVEITHYHSLPHGYLCHFIIPQYNTHGNFMIGKDNVKPFYTAPTKCAGDSYPVELFFYHGSIGYYSFYDELVGTYCKLDNTAYTHVAGVGTFDINGLALARDLGSGGYRWSYWFCIVGACWLTFRGLVLRRCYIVCKRYGVKCSRPGIELWRKEATIFVHENLRLSAHGATNYHRVLLLYLLLEGLMGDLFLLAATDGSFAWIQYVSLGYNLSGILLIIFEIIEATEWLSENSRLFIKRLIFSYESSLLGELLGALIQPMRNKMTMLAAYHWENEKLYYRADALKSFGLLKMEEEDGSQFVVLNKVHWFSVRAHDLTVIGSVSENRVEPCAERPCMGVISFFDHNLGGPVSAARDPRSAIIQKENTVSPSPTLSVVPT
ncbi:unnamed protein product [Phytophthora fragariaefolia]|uniref:Unnamed protein product n=1 Tax=Phytophthora fragariaefolia TaxID=1490495 RepID=A0A9W7CIT1_9STRA|nr:unnamed protein product [Phytophthora fragariaefolia]